MTVTESILDSYRAALMPVFPCKPHDHSPASVGWQQTPLNANIGSVSIYGVLLPFYVFVIDYDPRNDDEQQSQWNQFIQRFDLPPTYTVRTGGGGFHFYYSKPLDHIVKGKAPHFPSIDIKTGGGFVIGPGSTHRDGGTYEVVNGSPSTITAAPADLLYYLKRELSEIQTEPGTTDDSEPTQALFRNWIMAGGWENGTYQTACMGHDYGLSPDTIKTIMLDIYNACRGAGAKTEAHIESRIDHAFRYAQNAHGCKNTAKQDFENIREKYSNARSKTKSTYAFKKWDVNQRKESTCSLNNVMNYFLMDEIPDLPGDNPLTDLVRFNSFAERVEFTRPAPWHKEYDDKVQFWRDVDTDMLEAFLGQHTTLTNITSTNVDKAVSVIAHDLTYNPLKEYLMALKWDGVERVDGFLALYANAADNPYTQEVSRIMLLGAVGRALEPGIKYDTMPILEAPQGYYKSTFAEILGGEYYSTSPLDPRNKDTFVNMLGKWWIEIAELDGMRQADVNSVKTFLSTREDSIRLPYDRRGQKLKRRCTFIGTMNPEGKNEYFQDRTGNRRFYPVHVGRANIELLARDRDQIYAEAVHRFLVKGEKPFCADTNIKQLIEEEQAKRLSVDSWTSVIQDWLVRVYAKDYASYMALTTANICMYCLEIPKERLKTQYYSRVNAIMLELGYVERRIVRTRGFYSYWIPAFMDGV